MSSEPLDVLLEYLKRTRGFDFSGYKRASLERRIRKRMEAVGADGYLGYVDYLEVHPEEFSQLFNTILINVTGFFRDPASWDYLATDVVPRLLERIKPSDPIRAWCAGCSSGEETYTMAMILAEALGEAAYRERVKIYATDVDDEALKEARHARYTAKQVEGVPPELRERYLERVDQRYTFRKDLRQTVIFGRNDLVQDAPISRIDVLTCRNTLMYFNAETQARILSRFHFALNSHGYLFLGKSEMLITHSDLFKPVDSRRRVFTKVVKPTLRDRLMLVARPDRAEWDGERAGTLGDTAFEVAPVAQVIIDSEGMLAMANGQARSMFGLSVGDIGRPLKDLELSYRPAELRGSLERAYSERRRVVLDGVAATVSSGEVRDLDVHITPLHEHGHLVGATVAYHDVTAQRRLQDELESSKRELETAYEELQSTVEELETTNEELQSTNEELETTNEELQSTNEELETMNEELQSTNEELETTNDELRVRSTELNEVNAFLETILSSLGVAVIVIDREQTVRAWNDDSTELWGVRPDEAEGRHLLALDMGLPLDGVATGLRDVLSGAESRYRAEVTATNRRGRAITVRVTCLPLVLGGGDISGAILLTEQLPGRRAKE